MNLLATTQALSMTLFLCGDVMTGRGIDQILPRSVAPVLYESYVKDARDYVRLAEKKNGPIRRPVGPAYVWGQALDVWQQVKPDVKIINLETSITTHPQPWPGKEVHYRMHPANVSVLQAAGIDLCLLANNHTLDWGRKGLQETLQTLEQARIPFAGAGQDLAQARQPARLRTPAGRLLVFAYGASNSGIPAPWAATPGSPGLNLLADLSQATVRQIAAQVKEVKKPGDVVLFSVHWGPNWGYEIPDKHQDFARQLIAEAGVDLVFGHSSHHPMGLEVYRGKLIVYGAGDFLNDYEGIGGQEQFRGNLTLMYFPTLDPASGRLQALLLVPMQIRNFRLQQASAQDAAWLEKMMQRFNVNAPVGRKDNRLFLRIANAAGIK